MMIAVAMAMVVPMLVSPYHFDDDLGIEYVRSVEASLTELHVAYTSLNSDYSFVDESMTNWPLTICNVLIILVALYLCLPFHPGEHHLASTLGLGLSLLYLVIIVVMLVVASDLLTANGIASWPTGAAFIAMTGFAVLRRISGELVDQKA